LIVLVIILNVDFTGNVTRHRTADGIWYWYTCNKC